MKKAYGTDSLWKEDPSAGRGGFLSLLLQLTYHFAWIPFRSYKYIDAKTLAWLRTWTCGSFCLVVYCKPVQQSAFLVMMLIFAREVKWSSLFLRGKRADGNISRHAAFWVKRRHREWLDLKAKTRNDLVCSLQFPLFKDNSWLPFHCISKGCCKWHVSTPGICSFQNTE